MSIGHYRASDDDLKEFSTYEKDGIYVSSFHISLSYLAMVVNLYSYKCQP